MDRKFEEMTPAEQAFMNEGQKPVDALIEQVTTNPEVAGVVNNEIVAIESRRGSFDDLQESALADNQRLDEAGNFADRAAKEAQKSAQEAEEIRKKLGQLQERRAKIPKEGLTLYDALELGSVMKQLPDLEGKLAAKIQELEIAQQEAQATGTKYEKIKMGISTQREMTFEEMHDKANRENEDLDTATILKKVHGENLESDVAKLKELQLKLRKFKNDPASMTGQDLEELKSALLATDLSWKIYQGVSDSYDKTRAEVTGQDPEQHKEAV